MKNIKIRKIKSPSHQWITGTAGLLLLVCALLPAGCGGPGAKPAVAAYQASVTYVSPDQTAADGQFIAKLFAEQAAVHGLVSVKPVPPDAAALYFPGATGLNLSLSALYMANKSIAVSLVPVNMGKKDNTVCQAVITTLQHSLKQNFGARLVELH